MKQLDAKVVLVGKQEGAATTIHNFNHSHLRNERYKGHRKISANTFKN